MTRVNLVRVTLLFVTSVSMNLALSGVAHAESFDKPIRETTVDLGPTPYMLPSSGARIKLFCSYYPTFMVKQLNDEGQKGTQEVTIVHIRKGIVPSCRRSHAFGQRVIDKDGRFFIGVKNQLLFLEDPDGDNGGMYFHVVDWKNGKELFRDSALLGRTGINVKFVDTSEGEFSLSYRRVVAGDCSIAKDGMSCWNKFKEKLGLQSTEVPTCTGYRTETEKERVVGDPGVPPEELDTPSVIVYPVAVELFPTPSVKAAPGLVNCWPVS